MSPLQRPTLMRPDRLVPDTGAAQRVLGAYQKGISNAQGNRQREQALEAGAIANEGRRMELGEFRAQAPQRTADADLLGRLNALKGNVAFEEAGARLLGTVDPDAPQEEFDRATMDALVGYERTMVEDFGMSPEQSEQIVRGMINQGMTTREGIRTLQEQEGVRATPLQTTYTVDKSRGQIIASQGGRGVATDIEGLRDLVSSTPGTDIDDFVADANADSLASQGRPLTPGERNRARLQFKRSQSSEAYDVEIAKRTAKGDTAQRISFLDSYGKRLAEIETAPALSKAKGEETAVEKKTTGQAGVSKRLAALGNIYINLNKQGAMVNTTSTTPENIYSSIRSSEVGQMFGKALGTEEQSFRNSVQQLKPLLIQDIRKATNMGARGMDSEKELEFYLKAATDEKSDMQATVAAIIVLDDAYGSGEVARQLQGLTDPELVANIRRAGEKILAGGSPGAENPAGMSDAELLKGLGL